jgi:hypothetical protein
MHSWLGGESAAGELAALLLLLLLPLLLLLLLLPLLLLLACDPRHTPHIVSSSSVTVTEDLITACLQDRFAQEFLRIHNTVCAGPLPRPRTY